jgi:hypothetical protein
LAIAQPVLTFPSRQAAGLCNYRAEISLRAAKWENTSLESCNSTRIHSAPLAFQGWAAFPACGRSQSTSR